MDAVRRMQPFDSNNFDGHRRGSYKNTSGRGIYKIKNSKVNNIDIACDTFRDNLANFLENTSLHGLRYTGDQNISVFERSFFVIAFIVVFSLSSFFISILYSKWSATPIIIGISPTPTYISNIPFPAVTICNLNQAMKSRVKNIKKDSSDLLILQSLCAADTEFNITDGSPVLSRRWSYVRNLLLNVSQPCGEMIVRCQFGSKEEDCDNIFEPVLSDEGLCCTFNSVHPKYMYMQFNKNDAFDEDDVIDGPVPVNWTPETGFSDNLPPEYYPRKAMGTGSHMGLTLVLNASANEYYCSSTSSVGFKILLHSPIESPKIANYGFLMPTGKESRVLITPSFMDASPSIKNINRRFRHCMFANEANLTFYRTYSKKNCELECESRILEEECGCVMYYMPRTSPETVICGFKDYGCTRKTQRDIELSRSNRTCDNCLPACFELSYTPQISSTNFANKKFIVREAFLENFPYDFIVNNLAIIHIYYSSNSFRSRTKEELIGFTEFLSNTGGILGLFMGFSVVSFIEILYFMSIRPYCSIRNRIRKLDTSTMEKFVKSKDLKVSDYNSRKSTKIFLPMNTKNQLNRRLNGYEPDSDENRIFKTQVNHQISDILCLFRRERHRKRQNITKPLPYYE